MHVPWDFLSVNSPKLLILTHSFSISTPLVTDDAVRILNVANTLVELYRDAQRRRQEDDNR